MMTVRNTLCTSYSQCLRKFIFSLCVLIINVLPAFQKMESLLVVIFLQAISNVDGFVDFCFDKNIERKLRITCERIVIISAIDSAITIGLLVSNHQWSDCSIKIVSIIKIILITSVILPAIVLWHDKEEFKKECD